MVDLNNEDYSDNEGALEEYSVQVDRIHKAQKSTVSHLLDYGFDLKYQTNEKEEDFEALECIKFMEKVNLLNG